MNLLFTILGLTVFLSAAAGPVGFSQVDITDNFWKPRIDRHAEITVPFCLDQCMNQTGRVDNFAVAAGFQEGSFQGLFYDDSDLYKMIEGASYSLQNKPDAGLESVIDSIIEKIAGAQQEDGYLDTWYILHRPGERWTDMDKHEMYCCGHLIEAAIAYEAATGKRTLLDVAVRFADHLTATFGEGLRDWVPGHPEIELALIKLYRHTGNLAYLELSRFLLEERGKGKGDWKAKDYYIDYAPVRELRKIQGHAVRAMYLFTGMADYSAVSLDKEYLPALDSLWEDVTCRKMYITGGIGSSRHNEGFTEDYDLPNAEAYCETCASVGMVMWNQRMNMLNGDSKYIDVLERSMYNGALAGISLSSDRFFYVNPLASDGTHHRRPWFGTACCPSQISRFLPSVGGYIYSVSGNSIDVNLYIGSKTDVNVDACGQVSLAMSTDYPWDGKVKMDIEPSRPGRFALRLRIPGWCREWNVSVNGRKVQWELEKGYMVIDRKWRKGDSMELDMQMDVEVLQADPRVKADEGRRALMRGPLVYCIEETDNDRIEEAYLSENTEYRAVHEPELLDGVTAIYADNGERTLKFIPYYAWDNRGPGRMEVWVRYREQGKASGLMQSGMYGLLPLGAVKAEGWLKEMLLRQGRGMSSQMDELYPEVMGARNGWLGGDGDQWERGPYWIDGLLPLAYILDDSTLKEKVRPWVEWAISSQRPDGSFGPDRDYGPERGLQRNNSEDWWPRMVVLKVLQQYYDATSDPRVLDFMTEYFRYQLRTLPEKPLGHWTFWARYRACDNISAVQWLYEKRPEPWLLDLGHLLHRQGVDYTEMFLGGETVNKTAAIHCVNLAQGLKEPVVYWRLDPQAKYIEAVKKGLEDIMKYNGFPNGMYGGDEALHGNNPTQGSELCSAVELMYSLEEMARITGDMDFIDHLERIAFNALPAQITDDFMARQYFQQANQVMVTRNLRNFDINHGTTDLVFGLLTGYPCCTSNLHQGWPKFTRNLWLSTDDGGLAALAYSPSSVKTVIGATDVSVLERTSYPMDGTVSFEVSLSGDVSFPLHLRIPSWTRDAVLKINGVRLETPSPGTIAVISRTWSDGDVVELVMPMDVRCSRWHENSVSVERGPLVYALKIEEEWVQKEFTEEEDAIYGKTYWEVYPKSPWNYGLLSPCVERPEDGFKVETDYGKLSSDWYWNQESCPLKILAKARRIPSWQLYNDMAGPLPYSEMYGLYTGEHGTETVELVPYGCTALRISEFPVIKE